MMRSLYINEELLSKSFWAAIYHHIESDPGLPRIVEDIMATTQAIRAVFPPGLAGSIDRKSVMELVTISKYFSPRRVCEIGTYIGRSAFSVIAGSPLTIQEFHTCDYSFDQFYIPNGALFIESSYSLLKYHAKTSSTTMLTELLENAGQEKYDFFFIDGRLGQEDIKLLKILAAKDAVFVFDDFEGTEKGVVNALGLSTSLNGYILIRPSNRSEFSNDFSGKIALLIPSSIIRIARQQIYPHWM